MTGARAQWPVALAAIVVPLGVAAQQPQPPAPSGQCQLVYAARDSLSPPRISATKLPSGQYNTFIGGGVIARCPAQNMTLISDSAENYGDQKLLHLIGHVHYTEPRLTEDSELADYYQADEHLVASGNVHAVLPSGTTLDGPHVDYYRVAPNIRTVAKMVATGRPTITIIEHDSTGKPSQPMTVVANTVDMEGDSLTYASMNVVITRTDVIATGDSAAMNSGTEFARLMRKPTIKARGDRPFTLTGDLIDLFGRNKAVDREISRGVLGLRPREMRRIAERLRTDFEVKSAGIDVGIRSLSGGNQQKVAIAAAVGRKPDVLVLEEPTRGVDISSKAEIYEILRGFAADGGTVVLFCTEVPEVYEVADRLHVVSDGRLSTALEVSGFADMEALAKGVASLETHGAALRSAVG